MSNLETLSNQPTANQVTSDRDASRNGTVYSPKQVAVALGVSESSVKRWCDKGRIDSFRTAGGHRRIRTENVIEFVRETRHRLVAPEMLGLKTTGEVSGDSLKSSAAESVDALLNGDGLKFREILVNLYLSKHPLSMIFDQVVAPAFHEIGARWECDDADIYQERRSCEICIRSLLELRKIQPEPPVGTVAIGGTLTGDIYTLPSTMADLVLRDCRIAATSLGTNIPASSYLRAIYDLRPSLVWLSVSHIADEPEFLAGVNAISKLCFEKNIALVVGGRALNKELRKNLTYSSFCDTMQHLESFARTLPRVAN